jgi:alkylglycerol monooxygenase
MEKYAAILNYAIPFFMSLLVIEWIISKYQGKEVIRGMDTLSSLSSGITNVIKDVLGLTFVIISYDWLESKVGLFQIESTWLVYLLAFIGLDFAGYWNHRLSHQVNYFWNAHIIHHSSEEFNLACALRQSISTVFGTLVVFLIPTAIIGVPETVIAVVAPLHLFAQYWYHTQLIGKMGFLEKILVTPSHHRVHHAINNIYLDKNHSQIFIIWDKLFGTYQEELASETPVYGVKRPVRTWNPVIINFVHFWQLIKDAYYTKSWIDKLRIWLMPTGWRPKDVSEKYPITTITEVFKYEKYNPKSSTSLQVWIWIQFFVAFAMMMHLFGNIANLSFATAVIYGAFITFAIFSLTSLMDRSRIAWVAEWIVFIVAFGIWFIQSDWFLLDTYLPQLSLLPLAYFFLVGMITSIFHFREIINVHYSSQ